MGWRPVAVAIVIGALGIAACSTVGSTRVADPTIVSRSPELESTAEIAGVAAEDIAAAEAYFAAFAPDPEGPLLPESARTNQLVAGCLESFGVSIIYAGAGGIYRPNTPQQRMREDALMELCWQTMARQGLVSFSESDPAIVGRRYEAYLEAYQCLGDQGVEVDAPPSFDAFLEGESWSPFSGVPTIINDKEGKLEGPAVDCAVP